MHLIVCSTRSWRSTNSNSCLLRQPALRRSVLAGGHGGRGRGGGPVAEASCSCRGGFGWSEDCPTLPRTLNCQKKAFSGPFMRHSCRGFFQRTGRAEFTQSVTVSHSHIRPKFQARLIRVKPIANPDVHSNAWAVVQL